MKRRSVSEFEAVGLALASYTCWVLADTSLKIVGASRMPVLEVIGFVGLAVMVWLFLYAAVRGNLRLLWPGSPGRQLLRSSLELINNTGVVIALRHLPLALFYILVFAAPMVTTLLAAGFLGERLEWKKSLAILTGFVGVVVAVNPFGAARPGDWVGYVACMVCVCAYSTNVVWSRVMTQSESPESLTFFSGGLMAVVGLGSMLLHAEPVSPKFGGVLLAAGLFAVVGSLCFFVALKHAPAAVVSQYHYSQLLTGTLIAYAIWRETLTTAMVCGAVLIVGAGWYTAARSYRGRVAEGVLGATSGHVAE